MYFDLRIPMGWMFALAGAILTLFGLATSGEAAIYAPSLGYNVNLWWGPALLAFGLILLLLGRRGQRRLEEGQLAAPAKGNARRGR